MGLTDFLKDVGKEMLSNARLNPIVGPSIMALAPDDTFKGSGIDKVAPLSRTMGALEWTYSNVVSQPISTYLLQVQRDDPIDSFFSASDWTDAWTAAEHVSPGQALFMQGADEAPIGPAQILANFYTDDGDEAAATINAKPLYYEPAASALPAGFDELSEDEQQEILKKAGMPVVGNRRIQELQRDTAWFSFASGLADATLRWYADPLVVAGKGIGAVRNATYVQARPNGGWSRSEIAGLMESSKMRQTRDWLWQNKDSPDKIRNLSMFAKSPMGPRAASVISRLQSPREVDLFLRTSMGDLRARATLERVNKTAAHHLQQDTARLSTLGLALPKVQKRGLAASEALIKQRMTEVEQQINANTDLVERYRGALAHYSELDAINLSRRSARKAEIRTAAEREYRAGPARPTAARRMRGGGSPAHKFMKITDDLFGTPVTVVRGLREMHPNGLIAVDDIHKESVDELRGHLSRIPGIGPDIRQDILNRYLRTSTEGERLSILDEVGHLGASQIAMKHGFTKEEGLELYRQDRRHVGLAQEDLRRYSASVHPGENIHVDEFMDAGGKLVVHPNLATRLVNDHVMQDLGALDDVLRRHASPLKALRTKAVGNTDWMVNTLDWTNRLWKFGTLFRLGYIPRVLADDLMGQVARLGAATMAVRAGYGVKNAATNLSLRNPGKLAEAREATLREGMKFTDEEIAKASQALGVHQGHISQRVAVATADRVKAGDRLRRARNKLNRMDSTTPAVQLNAMKQLVTKYEAQARAADQAVASARGGGARAPQVADLQNQLDFLRQGRTAAALEADEAAVIAGRGRRQHSQLHGRPEVAGMKLPGAFEGARGEYFQKTISSDDQIRNLFQTNKNLIHGNLVRAYGNSGVSVSYAQGQKKFVEAWHKAINHQIMQDELGRMAAIGGRGKQGASIDEMAHWLKSTPQGRLYRKRLGIKYDSNERIAASVFHDVDNYLPTPEVRMAAAEGKADIEFLKVAAEKGHRPMEVHTTDLGQGLAGSNGASRGVDAIMDWWFKTAAAIPADRMSRHPLFNQLYEKHAKNVAEQEIKQGAKLTLKDADRIAETARRMALRDTRGLVFDIAHRSDVSHALRFLSPFFASTTEAWQRWARIIADKPQTVGYGAQFFNAPTAMGWMQDRDGNRILRDGTIVDPVTGKRRSIPKNERMIVARLPQFLLDTGLPQKLGLNPDGELNIGISQNSVNMITQGDPWFNPGTGPIVAFPVNEWVRDKPKQAELARHLGILPFGPETGSVFGDGPVGRALGIGMPQAVKNFLTAWDSSDERYQRIKLHIMQKAAYEHDQLGKPMPSAEEIADRTRDHWLKSAAWSFIQPAATSRTDRFEFYRQQYRNLRRKNYLTADQEFIERFGESHFVFAASTSDTSMPPTERAAELFEQNKDLIAKNPELAALIIGPNADGPFSPEAWAYSLTTPLVPGDSEMSTRRLSAQEAMAENTKRKGWAKYTQLANYLTSELHKAGFESFSDEGAEQFADWKSQIPSILGNPTLPDGSKNEYYNEEWSKDFFSLDARKYDRLIPHLEQVAYSRLAEKSTRSDLRVLQTYLEGRKELQVMLRERAAAGGAKTLAAQANLDLALGWTRFVDSLVERDTRFGDLHHRYLSRDMGVDVEEEA